MTKTVAVALSGGVDSAVTAAILLEQGYKVIGITCKMICSENYEQILMNAKRVADKLGIEHYSLDATKDFEKHVLKYFENSYKQGETPNPCIMCNQFIKWGVLFDYAVNELKVDYVATGHYADIKFDAGLYKLYPAFDSDKDQLYFLYTLTQEHLSKTLFPLSKYKKSEVRALAEKYDLPPKSSRESQDICFIKPPMTTKKYLNTVLSSEAGCFVEKATGKILGKHDGYWQYTIGQRKGIGIAASEPLYVVGLEPVKNIVYVGYKEDLRVDKIVLPKMNWNYPNTKKEFEALVKIRYNMQAIKSKIICGENIEIFFSEPVLGVARGQACVLYDISDGHLIGGSFI